MEARRNALALPLIAAPELEEAIDPGDELVERVLRKLDSQLLQDFDRDQLGEQIVEMMEIVGLPLGKLQEYPYELSKGQRQRVAVMRSLMLSPSLYIADEPTLGVDANNRPKIVDLLEWYRKRTDATLVLVSHDIGMLEALAQRVIVMQQGRAVGEGAINDIFRFADHDYVQQLATALRATAYDEVADE